MNEHFFTFQAVADMIVKKKYKRSQYDVIKKLLLKIKAAYLEEKQKPEPDSVEAPKNTKEEQEKAASGVITEEDFVDVKFLDEQVSLVDKKFKDKRELWEQFIIACR